MKIAGPASDTTPNSLPVQADLSHRGGFGTDVAALFPPAEMFSTLGGQEVVARLVDGLYDRIEKDAVLRPAFGRDLTRERERQKRFFTAWFGGDRAYFDAAWPPGLHAAHGSVSISRGMAGRWVGHFLDSLAAVVEDQGIIRHIKPLIARLAMGLVNREEEPVPGERLHGSSYGVDTTLLQLVRRDDAEGLRIATERSGALRVQGPRLLLIAASQGKLAAAETLLHLGVDANAVAMLPGGEASSTGLGAIRITPLCAALAKRHAAVVQLLMAHGAQYDIFSASYLGDGDAVRELLDCTPELADADDPACDVARITPLLHAVAARQLAVARLLLQRGATVGANSVRLLALAANAGDIALTDLLLEHGADPTALAPGPWTLYPALAERLIAHGATINREPGAWIGLCCTGNSGHRENEALADALLRCGADVTARYKGRTALHCAAKAGYCRVAESLLAYGADVNARDDTGRTPLDAVEEAGKRIARAPMEGLLIRHGARRSDQLPVER